MFYNMFSNCSSKSKRALFPYDVENRFFVILINILHIIGILAIQFGILLPGNLIKYYILYLVFLFMSYILLNNRCFMTVFSNYIGKRNYNSLCIKMNEAQIILFIYLVISLIIYFNPKHSLYNLIIKIF